MNLSYILWVAAFNTVFLLAYIAVLDLGIYASPSSFAYDNPYIEPTPPAVRKHRAPMSPDSTARANRPSLGAEDVREGATLGEDEKLGHEEQSENPPRLLKAINHHGLTVFLLVRSRSLCLSISSASACLLIHEWLTM